MPKKILIIDDDPAVVRYLMAVFSDNGYATCSASSSMEGLDVVKTEKPDLICLDLQMPGEWGPRFYRKLRKDKALRDTWSAGLTVTMPLKMRWPLLKNPLIRRN
jgi:CheY-like chemotaxis protein